jgi:hypothetical protein
MTAEGFISISHQTVKKTWRHEYAFQGRRSTLTFGSYPEVSLKDAREKLVEAKRALREGIDPGQQKKNLEKPDKTETSDTFEAVAREWFDNKKNSLKESYTSRIKGSLELELFPFLSMRPIAEISAPELLEVMRKVESRGAVDKAHRCLQYCGQILSYPQREENDTYLAEVCSLPDNVEFLGFLLASD